ncbi:MAG: hypothetical protein EA402_13485 [Planctomycetota bacterium]|nr:MAG: hypothetical protein EA402_13485 [Planctomycetota bacterium]
MPHVALLPDLDILRRAFDRRDPDPLVVHQVVQAVDQRRLFVVGWVRQSLISRAAEVSQAERLARALAAFPDLPISSADHVAAAFLSQRLRRRSVLVQPAQALFWVMAERIQACIWSQDQRWHALHAQGCPVVSSPQWRES